MEDRNEITQSILTFISMEGCIRVILNVILLIGIFEVHFTEYMLNNHNYYKINVPFFNFHK